MLLLVSLWWIKFRRILIFADCSIEEATHFWIYNWDDTYTIVRKKTMKGVKTLCKFILFNIRKLISKIKKLYF